MDEQRLVFMDPDKNILRGERPRIKPWTNSPPRSSFSDEKKTKNFYQGPIVVVSPPRNYVNTEEKAKKTNPVKRELIHDMADESETAELVIKEQHEHKESRPKKNSDFSLPSVKNVKKKLQTLFVDIGRGISVRI